MPDWVLDPVLKTRAELLSGEEEEPPATGMPPHADHDHDHAGHSH
jgi:hypothetical protein